LPECREAEIGGLGWDDGSIRTPPGPFALAPVTSNVWLEAEVKLAEELASCQARNHPRNLHCLPCATAAHHLEADGGCLQ